MQLLLSATVMKMFNCVVFLLIGLTVAQETTSELLNTETTTSLSTSTTELLRTTLSTTTTSEVPNSSSSETPSSSTETPSSSTETPSSIPTTDVPPTTEPPNPEEGTWNIKQGNITCIRAVLAIEFKIADQNDSILLSPNATSSNSDCNFSNVSQTLVLAYDNYVLVFEFEKDSTSTFVRNVTFTVGTEKFYNGTKLFLVKSGNSYLCKTTDAIPLGNATMSVHKIQIQAFGSAGETEFSTPEECELDDSVSDVVPIAVACALASLIVVVLIAYLVGRRRFGQKGYTSV